MDAQRLPQAGDEIVQVKITNKNDFPIKDRFDNVEYVFLPDKPVRVPLPVAAHCFGYRLWFKDDGEAAEKGHENAADGNWKAMLKYCSVRHGWNDVKKQSEGLDEKYFEKIEIVNVTLHLVEDVEEPARGKKV